MRRVLQFFDSEVSRWNKFAAEANFSDGSFPEVLEGRRAYAYQQANIRAAMRSCCAQKWKTITERVVLAGDFIDSATGFVKYRPSTSNN